MSGGAEAIAAPGRPMDPPPARPGFYPWIWRHSRGSQLMILGAILLSLPLYFLALDLPRQIINGPIQGHGFAGPAGAARYLVAPAWFADWPMLAWLPRAGVALSREAALVALSLALLALVIINGAAKCAINIAKGRLGERMLRRLRYELFERILTGPPARVRRLKGAEVASAIKDEVEPLGGFIGEAFATPVFLGGQALTAAAFILLQNAWLGLIALGIIAIQGLLIPRLRRRLLELGRQRQQASRALAGHIAGTVESADEVRVNGAGDVERAGIAARLARIYDIRLAIYQRKFLIKFLNNWLAQLPPFLFFLVGGAFVLAGRLDIGQLLAVLVAYKDLPGPIAELIDWDYLRQDAELRFEQVQQVFGPAPESAPPAAALSGDGSLVGLSGLAIEADAGAGPVRGVDLAIFPGEHIGAGPDSRSGLVAMAIAGLVEPAAGRIVWRAGAMPPRLAYAGEDPVLTQATLREALLYGLSRPPKAGLGHGQRRLAAEAAAAGTPFWPEGADWVDHERLGAAPGAETDGRLAEALRLVGFDDKLLALALRCTIEAEREPALAASILQARQVFRELLAAEGLDRLVAPFEPRRYNVEASIADNLIFGQFRRAGDLQGSQKAARYLTERAGDLRLERRLLTIGAAMATAAADLYGDLDSDDRIVAKQPFVPPEAMVRFRAIIAQLSGLSGPEQLDAASRADLVELALGYIEPRHRLGLLSARFGLRIVARRRRLKADRGGAGEIVAFDPSRFSDTLSLEENIVFGMVVQNRAEGPRRVLAVVRRALAESGALARVQAFGLGSEIGIGGRNLTLAERQQVALARALLRRPDLLVVNRALSALAGRAQAELITGILADLRERAPDCAVFWVQGAQVADGVFDRRLVCGEHGFDEKPPPAGPARRSGDSAHDH